MRCLARGTPNEQDRLDLIYTYFGIDRRWQQSLAQCLCRAGQSTVFAHQCFTRARADGGGTAEVAGSERDLGRATGQGQASDGRGNAAVGATHSP